ncbi:MAG: hypothetical protein JKY42_10105, partial [Flavobacteriales bacterium]|nr:hypothetical protein [Flavobacteriales bacterium]
SENTTSEVITLNEEVIDNQTMEASVNNEGPIPVSIVTQGNVENTEQVELQSGQLETSEELSLMKLLETAQLSNEINFLHPEEDFIEGGKNPIKFELGIYGGVMYVGKYLKSSSTLSYVERRQNEEIGKLSFNSGLDLNLKYGKFLISTGVNYHQQGEVTNYSNEYEKWVVTRLIDYNVIDNSFWQLNTSSFTIITDDNFTVNVDTVLTYYDETNSTYVIDTVSFQSYEINNIGTQQFNLVDSTYVVQLDSTANVTLDSSIVLVTDAKTPQQKTTTRFSYIEIPVLIGIEMPVNRLTLSVRTGVGVGMLTKHEAKYLISDYTAPQLVDKSQVNQLMINYLLRLGVRYSINENLAISCEPFYRLNLSNVMNSTDLSQKYWNAGLNVGVVYGF